MLQVEIRVVGAISVDAARALGLEASDAPVESVLRGTVCDRAALYGVLARLDSAGLELIDVRRLPASAAHVGLR